jgi:hypothetical protein
MPDYRLLRDELINDPVGLGYSGLSNGAAAARLNATDTGRTLPRSRVEVTEIFNAIDDGAWPATAILQDKLRGILAMPFIDASNTNTRGIFGAIFPNSGATAATRGRLLALSTRTVSRAEELGLGLVNEGDVALARGGEW